MNIDQNLIIITGLGIAILILAIVSYLQNRKIRNLLGNENAKSIENHISQISQRLLELENFRKNSEQIDLLMENRMKGAIRGFETIRFNPFKGTGAGGNQSFATALISEDGDGVIISSLYSREHVSLFAKPVKKFVPEFELTNEEKEALMGAKERAGVK